MKKYILPIVLSLLFSVGAFAQYDKDVFMWRGRKALSDGKYANAIEQFNVLTRLDSTDYWSFFFRGIAKYNLGDYRGADKDFNTSIRLNLPSIYPIPRAGLKRICVFWPILCKAAGRPGHLPVRA